MPNAAMVVGVAIIVGVGCVIYETFFNNNNRNNSHQNSRPPRNDGDPNRHNTSYKEEWDNEEELRRRRRRDQLKRNRDCVICMESLNMENHQPVRKLVCGHSFHFKCIIDWINIDRTCPICRRIVPPM